MGGPYNVYFARHGKEVLRVGHDIYLRWFLEVDGEWKRIVTGKNTRQASLDAAHPLYHRYKQDTKPCAETLAWELDASTRAEVLGECPKCLNPNLEDDLKTYRLCPDCGWRMDFTAEQMAKLEEDLKRSRNRGM